MKDLFEYTKYLGCCLGDGKLSELLAMFSIDKMPKIKRHDETGHVGNKSK